MSKTAKQKRMEEEGRVCLRELALSGVPVALRKHGRTIGELKAPNGESCEILWSGGKWIVRQRDSFRSPGRYQKLFRSKNIDKVVKHLQGWWSRNNTPGMVGYTADEFMRELAKGMRVPLKYLKDE